MTTIRLPYTDYCLTIRRAKNSEWQRYGKIALVIYTILNYASINGKVHAIAVDNMRSN